MPTKVVAVRVDAALWQQWKLRCVALQQPIAHEVEALLRDVLTQEQGDGLARERRRPRPHREPPR